MSHTECNTKKRKKGNLDYDLAKHRTKPKNIRGRLSRVSRAYRLRRHPLTERYRPIFWTYIPYIAWSVLAVDRHSSNYIYFVVNVKMQPCFFTALLRLWLELKCYQLPSFK